MNFVTATRSVPNPELTLVLMHGLGSDERDMAGLADMLDDRVEVICLRAPIQYGPGYAWFDIQWTLDGIQIDETQVWAQVDVVSEYLESLMARKLVVGGFSQGAMMALGVITKHPKVAKAVLLLSGRGLNEDCPEFDGKVFHAHGLFDDVIPIKESRELKATLDSLGDRYEYHEYEMGHWINDEELGDVNAWLGKLIELK